MASWLLEKANWGEARKNATCGEGRVHPQGAVVTHDVAVAAHGRHVRNGRSQRQVPFPRHFVGPKLRICRVHGNTRQMRTSRSPMLIGSSSAASAAHCASAARTMGLPAFLMLACTALLRHASKKADTCRQQAWPNAGYFS